MNVKEMTMKELVVYYNERADKPVKRFSDRKSAERRIEELGPALHSKTLSEAIRISWLVPETASKRSERSGVKVNGDWFKSVAAAFRALELPMNEHIKFRMQLKAEGELTAYNKHWEIIAL